MNVSKSSVTAALDAATVVLDAVGGTLVVQDLAGVLGYVGRSPTAGATVPTWELLMIDKNVRLILGALTGVVGLIAMIRLVAGAYSGHLSTFAWVFILLAMVPWIGYTSLRARHGNLTTRAALAVLALAVLGLLSVWLFTLGAVTALACSLAAFVVIWVHDWPNRRTSAGDHFVRIEDLATDERD